MIGCIRSQLLEDPLAVDLTFAFDCLGDPIERVEFAGVVSFGALL